VSERTVNPPAAPIATALVVLDLHRAVASPESRFLSRLRAKGIDTSYFEKRVAHEVIPNVNALAKLVRDSRGVVIWIRPETRTYGAVDWPISYRQSLVDSGFDTPNYEGLENFALLEGLDLAIGDHCLSSFSTSAFCGSPLLATLRNLEVTDVLITGCLTESGVVINAMDGTHTGFLSTVVEDACASISEERHVTSIALHSRLFKVARTQELIAKFKGEIS
jgi:nicotinamidase-related amidase